MDGWTDSLVINYKGGLALGARRSDFRELEPLLRISKVQYDDLSGKIL